MNIIYKFSSADMAVNANSLKASKSLRICLVGVLFVVLQQPSVAATLDRVSVIVNNDIITESELSLQLELAKRELLRQQRAVPPASVLRRITLERMVADRVQMQFADRVGINISEQEIDAAVQQVALSNQINVNQLNQTLIQDGIPISFYRQELKKQITIRRLIEQEISSRVSVTDSEIDELIQSASEEAGIEQEYELNHILISIPDDADAAEIEERKILAERLVENINDGENFEELAVLYSDSPTASEGGVIGWRKASRLPTLFLDALTQLQVGETSSVVRGDNGFHILRLKQKRGGQSQMVDQYHVRHILMKTDGILNEKELLTRMNSLRERIVSGEDFATVARSNSEDPNSRMNGGDLGWLSPGEVVPGFEQAVNTLQPGQLSPPIKTQYGYHLVELLGRRQHEGGEEIIRSRARQQLQADKSAERYDNWVRQLRDSAFVEYRNENI